MHLLVSPFLILVELVLLGGVLVPLVCEAGMRRMSLMFG